MKQELFRSFLLSLTIITLLLSSCYLRPADELPALAKQNETPEMAYQSFDDTTYSHENGFEYWDILSDQGKMFYDAMWNFTLSPGISYEANLYHFSPQDEFDKEAFYNATRFLGLDHPEKELMQFMNMSLYYSSDSENYQDVGIGSFVAKDTYDKKMSEIEHATLPIIQLVNAQPIKKEKYRLIHDWLVYSVKYDYESYEMVINENPEAKVDPSINNIYGALVNRLAVCDGISDAFKYLCNQCGLECITVQGEFPHFMDSDTKKYGHQWNLVYDENTWLLVDCTFDLSSKGHQEYFMVSPDIDGRISWYSLDY